MTTKNKKIEFDVVFKAILIGEVGVGKTHLINTSQGKPFDFIEQSITTNTFVRLKYIIDKINYTIELWNTAGKEKYREMTKLFYKNANIVIFVYDITNKKSFEELRNYWIKEVQQTLGDQVVYGIIGNKKDLDEEKEISEETVKQFANSKKMKFKLVSAKEEPKLFNDFLEELLKKSTLLLYERQTFKIHKKSIKQIQSKKKCEC